MQKNKHVFVRRNFINVDSTTKKDPYFRLFSNDVKKFVRVDEGSAFLYS